MRRKSPPSECARVSLTASTKNSPRPPRVIPPQTRLPGPARLLDSHRSASGLVPELRLPAFRALRLSTLTPQLSTFSPSMCQTANSLRPHSSVVVDGNDRAPARSMLRAVGFTDEDFKKPQIAVAASACNMTPCNVHFGDLSEHAQKGIDAAGGKCRLFQHHHRHRWHQHGHAGHALLPRSPRRHRRLHRDRRRCRGFRWPCRHRWLRQKYARLHDGHRPPRTARPSPSTAAALRLHPRRLDQEALDIVSVFEAVGKHAKGEIDDAGLRDVEASAIPGPGSCGGMYTANTMATGIEALGMSLPNSSAQLAVGKETRRLRTRRRRRHGYAEKRNQAPRHPHAPRLRECHHRLPRARRLDQPHPPPPRHRPLAEVPLTLEGFKTIGDASRSSPTSNPSANAAWYATSSASAASAR